MANFPLSSGNTSGKLSRITGDNFPDIDGVAANATTFLSKGIKDYAGVEYVYGVIIIESNGTAGSVLDITSMGLINDQGTVITTAETSAVQNDLFVLSPLERTGASAWTSDIPFMGTHNETYDSNSNVHTVLPAAITAGADSSVVTDSSGASSYLGVHITAGGEISILDAADAATLADVTAWIPLYNHQYILDNTIPQGRYGAILIKCDPRNVTVDNEILYSLRIGHNGINQNSQALDYQLTLKMTGDNVFIGKASYNNSNVIDTEELPAIKTLMSKIKNDIWTGYSWPTNVEPNVYSWGASSLTTGPYNHLSNVTLTSDLASYSAELWHQNIEGDAFDASIFVDVDLLNSMADANGSILNGNTLSAYDGSSYPESFDIQLLDQKGFINESVSGGGDKFEVAAGGQHTFNLEHKNTSNYWIAGTLIADDNSSNYLNFDHTDVNNYVISSPELLYTVDRDISIELLQSILIYPLFSYPQQTLDFKSSTINYLGSYSVDQDTPYTNQMVEHDGHTIKYFEGDQPLSIFTVNEIYSNSYNFVASTQTKSYHNIRINALDAGDEITKHLISENHCDASTNEVRKTTSENALEKTGAISADTEVPSATDSFYDYTVMMANNVEAVTSNEILNRDSDGQYSGLDSFRGYKSNTVNLVAPITKWKPGAFNGVNHESAILPFWITQGGPVAKSMSVKHSYYLTRPLFCLGYENVSQGISQSEVSYFEFLNPTGYTADNTTATGAKEWSTGNFRENSRSQLCAIGSEVMTCRYNADFSSGGEEGGDLVSYVDGNEIFNINDSAGFSGVTKRAFIKDFTAGGTSQTTFRVVDKDDVAIVATALVNEASYTADAGFDFTLKIGKPVYAAGERKVNFVHDVAIDGSIDERDRINCNYGTDISYTIPNRPINQILGGDTFYVETGGDHDDINNLHAGGTSVEKGSYTANAESSSSNGSLTIYNFNPKEKGLYNGAGAENQILSVRNFNADLKSDVYNSSKSDVIYCNLTSDNFASGTYSKVFKLFPFNAGDEDVLMINAEIFDPYYLPTGVFQSSPTDSNTPTWTISNNHTNNLGTGTAFSSGSPANTSTMLPSQVGGTFGSGTPLQKSPIMSDGLYVGLAQTQCDLNFEVATNAYVAGDYYKAIEFTYYRDSAYGQKRYAADGSVEVRPFGDRPIWKTRKLIRVTIDQHVGITLSDIDETSLDQSGTINFGSIEI